MDNMLSAIHSKIHNWWIFLLSGILLILLGCWVLIHPLAAYAGMSIYFSVALLVNGLFEIFFSITNRKLIHGWGWYLAGGIVDLAIGVILVSNLLLAATSLALLVGFWLIYRSVLAFGRSIQLKQMGLPDWGWLMVIGVIGLILSFMIIYNPLLGASTLVVWTGLALLAGGIFYIYFSFRLRSADKWMHHMGENSGNVVI